MSGKQLIDEIAAYLTRNKIPPTDSWIVIQLRKIDDVQNPQLEFRAALEEKG